MTFTIKSPDFFSQTGTSTWALLLSSFKTTEQIFRSLSHNYPTCNNMYWTQAFCHTCTKATHGISYVTGMEASHCLSGRVHVLGEFVLPSNHTIFDTVLLV